MRRTASKQDILFKWPPSYHCWQRCNPSALKNCINTSVTLFHERVAINHIPSPYCGRCNQLLLLYIIINGHFKKTCMKLVFFRKERYKWEMVWRITELIWHGADNKSKKLLIKLHSKRSLEIWAWCGLNTDRGKNVKSYIRQ